MKKKKRNPFLKLVKLFSLVFLFLILTISSFFIYYAKDLPRPEKFTERQFPQSTKILDRTGRVILYEIYGEVKRKIVPLSQIPDYLQKAVIVAEDANFYHHFGIDLKGIFRAIFINIKIKEALYGGSTIPQQLIRSAFLTLEKTPERKIRELILALELDRRYSKEQILEWYLNQVPFGQNSYGVEAASQTYFKKSVSQISLAEAAVLAALIQAPTYLSPYGPHKEKLLARKNYILERMVEKGYIDKKKAEEAKKEELKFSEIFQPIKAPHFTLWIKEQLEEKYGREFLEEQGLKIYTSLDWQLQEWAEEVIKEGVKRNKNFQAHNAALVAMDPKTGEILALVGSADWFAPPYPKDCQPGKNCLFDPKFNVALGTKNQPGRQPGSAFKPFVYATAFEKGYDDKTIVIDQKKSFGRWGGKEYIPFNYDGRFRGPVTLRQALAQSLNVPSVEVLNSLAGLEESIEMAKKMGITTLDKPPSFYGLALVLGGGEVKVLDMVAAYSVFANEGIKVFPRSILKIEDSSGRLIEENQKKEIRIISTKTARLINDILSDNLARAPIFGLRSPLYFPDYQVAVKTGSTQNFRDAWTIGYPLKNPSASEESGTPSIVVGVWVGNNDNSPTKGLGVGLAAPIFHNFLAKVLAKLPKENFKNE